MLSHSSDVHNHSAHVHVGRIFPFWKSKLFPAGSLNAQRELGPVIISHQHQTPAPQHPSPNHPANSDNYPNESTLQRIPSIFQCQKDAVPYAQNSSTPYDVLMTVLKGLPLRLICFFLFFFFLLVLLLPPPPHPKKRRKKTPGATDPSLLMLHGARWEPAFFLTSNQVLVWYLNWLPTQLSCLTHFFVTSQHHASRRAASRQLSTPIHPTPPRPPVCLHVCFPPRKNWCCCCCYCRYCWHKGEVSCF